MEYIRKTVDSKVLESLFTLPDTLRNRRVEVIILPIDESAGTVPIISLGGSLHKYANPELIKLEKDAWPSAAKRKHDNS